MCYAEVASHVYTNCVKELWTAVIRFYYLSLASLYYVSVNGHSVDNSTCKRYKVQYIYTIARKTDFALNYCHTERYVFLYLYFVLSFNMCWTIVGVGDAAMRHRWLIIAIPSHKPTSGERFYEARIMLNCCHWDELSMWAELNAKYLFSR